MKTKSLLSCIIVMLTTLLITSCDPWWVLDYKFNSVDISDKFSINLEPNSGYHQRNEHIGISVEYNIDPNEYEYPKEPESAKMTFRVEKLYGYDQYESYNNFLCSRTDQDDAILSINKDLSCIRVEPAEWDGAKKTGSFSISFPEQGEYLISYHMGARPADKRGNKYRGECNGEIKVKVSGTESPDTNLVDSVIATGKASFKLNECVPVKLLVSNEQIQFDSARLDISVFKKETLGYDEYEAFHFEAEENPKAEKNFHVISTGEIDSTEFETKNILSFIPVVEGEYLLDVAASAYKGDQGYKVFRSFVIYAEN